MSVFSNRYTILHSKKRLVLGIQVQTEFISCRSLHHHEVVTGRTLKDLVNRTIKNFKKAFGYATEFLHPNPPYYPSGTGESDLLEFILDMMHKNLKASISRKNNIFSGYMAFILFGCLMISERSIRLEEFTEGHLEVPKKYVGREEERRKEKEEKIRLCTIQSIGPNERGLSFDQVRQMKREKE